MPNLPTLTRSAGQLFANSATPKLITRGTNLKSQSPIQNQPASPAPISAKAPEVQAAPKVSPELEASITELNANLPNRNNPNFRFITRNQRGVFVHSIALHMRTGDTYVRTEKDGDWTYAGVFENPDPLQALRFYESGGFELARRHRAQQAEMGRLHAKLLKMQHGQPERKTYAKRSTHWK